MEAELEKLDGWINWIANNNGTQAHNDHFFCVALPRYTLLLLKRSYVDPVAIPPRVMSFFRHMISVVVVHIPKDVQQPTGLLRALFDERQHFFAAYGRPAKKKLAIAGVELDEAWSEALSEGDSLDVMIAPDDWVRGTLVTWSPTKTELEVEFPGKSGSERQWFGSDDPQLAPFGTKTGGAPAAAEEVPPTAEELAREEVAKERDIRWRASLRIGSVVDMEDKAQKWYQAMVVSAHEVPKVVADDDALGADEAEGAARDTAAADEQETILMLHVSFIGWPGKYDEWLPIDSSRIAPVNTRSFGENGKLSSHTFEPEDVSVVDDADDPTSIWAVLRFGDSTSYYLVDLINHFGTAQGFVALLQRVRNVEPPMPIGILRNLLNALGNVAKLLTRAFAQHWVMELFEAVRNRLVNADAATLRQLDLTVINDFVRNLRRLVRRCHTADDTAQHIEQLYLDLAGKLVTTDMLARRLDGLKMTLALVEWVRNYERFPQSFKRTEWTDNKGVIHAEHNFVNVARWANAPILVEFISRHDMITDYFVRRQHVQLMQRSLGVLQFLAEEAALTVEQLNSVWEVATSKRNTTEERKQVNRVLGQLFRSLPEEQRVLVAERLRETPAQDVSTLTIELIREMATSGLGDAASEIATEVLFNGSQDSSAWRDDLIEEAQAALEKVLSSPSLAPLRETYLTRCIANVRVCKSLTQSTKLMTSIMETYPVDAAEGVLSRSDLIGMLEAEHNLTSAWFTALIEFKRVAAETVVAMEQGLGEPLGDDDREMFRVGDSRQGFLDELRELLAFCSFFVPASEIMLSSDHVDALWDALNTKALSERERALCFSWFSDACKALSTSDGAAASATDTPMRGAYFTVDVALEFFRHKMSDVRGVVPMSPAGFHCLQSYFLFANHHSGSVRITGSGPADFEVNDLSLSGVDVIWLAVFRARSDSTAENAMKFLVSLQDKLVEAAEPLVGNLRRDAIQRCMDALTEASGGVRADEGAERSASVMLARRAVSMLGTVLDAADTESSGRAPPHLPRTTSGSPFKLKVMNTARGSPTKGQDFHLNVHPEDPLYDVLARVSDTIGLHPRVVELYVGTTEVSKSLIRKTLDELSISSKTTIIAISTLPRATKAEEEAKAAAEDSTDAAAEGESDEPATPPRLQKSDLASLPAVILSSNDDYFSTFMEVLEGPIGGLSLLSSEIWSLLMRIPTNSQVAAEVGRLRSVAAAEDPSVVWPRILDPESTPRVLYALQIVDRMLPVPLENTGGDHDGGAASVATEVKEDWLKTFLRVGGFEHLCSILLVADPAAGTSVTDGGGEAPSLLEQQQRELLLRVFRYCLMSAVTAASSEEMRSVIHQLGAAHADAAEGGDGAAGAIDASAGDESVALTDADQGQEERKGAEELPEVPPGPPGLERQVSKEDERAPQLDYSLAAKLLSHEKATAMLASVDLSQLQLRLLDLINRVSRGAATNYDASTVACASDLWVALTFHKPSLWYDVAKLGLDAGGQFMLSALSCTDGDGASDVRRHFAASLRQLCRHFPSNTPREDDPYPFAVRVLVGGLPAKLVNISHAAAVAGQYLVTSKLLRDGCALSPPAITSRELLQYTKDFTASLRVHESTEVSASSADDVVLKGMLDLLVVSISASPEAREWACSAPPTGAGLVAYLLEDCLFSLPRPRSAALVDALNRERESLAAAAQSDGGSPLRALPPFGTDAFIQSDSASEPPKCKRKASRGAAFELLGSLAEEGGLPTRSLLVERFSQLVEATGRVEQWASDPAESRLARCGYVGIRNLGCICYQNSLMQQMFMMDNMRRGVLVSPDLAEDKVESVLYQFQRMMAMLSVSERRAAQPQAWCHAYKDESGNPTNVLIQQDAQEYFNQLCDRLEVALKPTPQAALPTRVLGGTFSNQLMCLADCGTVKDRPEPFYCVSLQVQNRANVQESLQSLIEGEVISDYECETCARRVDVRKRACLDNLSNTLVMHLKRFEFNYDTFQREKVNDRYEFPDELDTYPYSAEGVARSDAADRVAAAVAEGAEPRAEDVELASEASAYTEHPPEYYEYQLVGVVIHVGTASSGHYYSYIRERGEHPRGSGADAAAVRAKETGEVRWFEFNDRVVSPFDPCHIGRECFGGPRTTSEYSYALRQYVEKQVTNSKSAYMLVYERKKPLPVPGPPRSSPTDEAGADAAASVTDNPAEPVDEDLADKKGASKAAGGAGDADPVARAVAADPLVAYDESGSVQMSSTLACAMWNDNSQFVHLSHVMGDEFGVFFGRFMESLARPLVGAADEAELDYEKYAEVGFRMLADLLVHAKRQTGAVRICAALTKLARLNMRACKRMLDILASDVFLLHDVLIRCPVQSTRQAVADLLNVLLALGVAVEGSELLDTESYEVTIPAPAPPSDGEADAGEGSDSKQADDSAARTRVVTLERPTTVTAKVLDHILDFGTLDVAGECWRHFREYFLVLRRFAEQGWSERIFMLQREGVMRVMDLYLGIDSPFHEVLWEPGVRSRPQMGTKTTPVDWTEALAFVSLLVRSCSTEHETQPPTLLLPPSGRMLPPLTPNSRRVVLIKPFYDASLRQADNASAVSEIIAHTAWEWPSFTNHVQQVIIEGLDSSDAGGVPPYFTVMKAFCSLEDSLQESRVRELLWGEEQNLLSVAKAYRTRYPSFTLAMIVGLLDVCAAVPLVGDKLAEDADALAWMELFLRRSLADAEAEAGVVDDDGLGGVSLAELLKAAVLGTDVKSSAATASDEAEQRRLVCEGALLNLDKLLQARGGGLVGEVGLLELEASQAGEDANDDDDGDDGDDGDDVDVDDVDVALEQALEESRRLAEQDSDGDDDGDD